MRGLSGAVVPSCERCALFVTKRHGWDRIETGDWPSLFTAIFFPVSFSGFGHFFRGVAEPAGFSALEITDDFSSLDRKSTRLNSSHQIISYAVFCLKKKKKNNNHLDRFCSHTWHRARLPVGNG